MLGMRVFSSAVLFSLVGFVGVGLAAERPVAVSPGSATGALIEGRSPAFSWGEAASRAVPSTR